MEDLALYRPTVIPELSDEQLQRLEELTRGLTPLEDMAVLLDLDEVEMRLLLDADDMPAAKIYRKTKAEMALKIRQNDIDLAENGSPTAAEKVSGYFSAMINSEH